MDDIAVVGAKGGVGTTTVAVALGALYGQRGLVSVEASPATADAARGDIATVAGRPVSDDGRVWFDGSGVPYLGIVDCGTVWPADDVAMSTVVPTVLVVSNDYLAVRRALSMPAPAVFVFVIDDRRALRVRELDEVLRWTGARDVPAVVVPYDLAVVRTVDAGLLWSRMPKALSPLVKVFDHLGLNVSV